VFEPILARGRASGAPGMRGDPGRTGARAPEGTRAPRWSCASGDAVRYLSVLMSLTRTLPEIQMTGVATASSAITFGWNRTSPSVAM